MTTHARLFLLMALVVPSLASGSDWPPAEADSMIAVGHDNLNHRNYEDAIQLFRDLVERYPNEPRAHLELSSACYRATHSGLDRDREEEGVLACRRAHQLAKALPYDLDCSRRIGYLCHRWGLFPEALEQYEAVLQADSTNVVIMIQMGDVLRRLGRESESKAIIEKIRSRGGRPGLRNPEPAPPDPVIDSPLPGSEGTENASG